MTDEIKLDYLRERIKEGQEEFDKKLQQEIAKSESWSMVSKQTDDSPFQLTDDGLNFVGKNLENGKFANENLKGANFSVANLMGVDFSGADLRGVDFSGANLTNANLVGADLSGAILSGAVLHGANFTKAKMHGIKLVDADLEDTILIDIDFDTVGLEELQELIEYLAKYFPHKLNLRKVNLTLLNLAQIDLSQVDLRGVDFTGVNFAGVNLVGLDLSECIITPEQIAQALGRIPGKEELEKILAPKKKKNKDGYGRLDMSELFLGNNKEFGIWNFHDDKGIGIDRLLQMGKKVFGKSEKPEIKDKKSLDEVRTEQEVQAKSHNEELRRIIEERKQKELAARKAMKENVEYEKYKEKKTKTRIIPVRGARGR